jgi:hypothetical protein
VSPYPATRKGQEVRQRRSNCCYLLMQVQVSPYPATRNGQEVRQSRSKLLHSLRLEVDELRQDILKKKTGKFYRLEHYGLCKNEMCCRSSKHGEYFTFKITEDTSLIYTRRSVEFHYQM